jgi:DNA invertase Pin-like site-specific DNA recombinase
VQFAQVELARDYGFSDIRVIADDMGKSAMTTQERCGWNQILQWIGSGAVGALFAVNAGRLAREMRDFTELVFLCRIYGVPLVLDGQPNDPRNPTHAALLYMVGTFAELDNRVRAEWLKQARLAKAARGIVVSQLPVGWVRRPDGSYAFDPEVCDRIAEVYPLFSQTGSIRGTVAALNRDKKLLPTRHRGRIVWKPATVDRVQRFLLNRAYAGLYVFGRTEMQFALGADARGRRVQQGVPEERWIRVSGLFPAYIAPEEQETIRLQVTKNAFATRNRPGRGRALCQGLAVCGVCGATLTVADPGPETRSPYYQCTRSSGPRAGKSCLSLPGRDLDRAVERAFLGAVAAPPVAALEQALAEARAAEGTRVKANEAERKRLQYAEVLARDRYENIDPRNCLVFATAVEEFEQAKQALKEFELRLANAPEPTKPVETADELQALCELVSDVPRLWRHPLVSMKERKEMLRCLVDRIVVLRTDEAIVGKIIWASGTETAVRVWRRRGLYRLIRRWHGQGMTVPDIQAALSVGDPETGQRWARTRAGIYQALKRLDLRPNPLRLQESVLAKINRLYDEGVTLDGIASTLNDDGHRTVRGNTWNANAVWHWLGRRGRRDDLEDIHRRALADAKARGLSNAQAAGEFNAQGIPRVGCKSWTDDAVRQRRTQLARRDRRMAKLEVRNRTTGEPSNEYP